MKKILIMIILFCISFKSYASDKTNEDKLLMLVGATKGQQILNICSPMQNDSYKIVDEKLEEVIFCYTSILNSFHTAVVTHSLLFYFDPDCFNKKVLNEKTSKQIVSEVIDYIMLNKNMRDTHIGFISNMYLLSNYKFPKECALKQRK